MFSNSQKAVALAYLKMLAYCEDMNTLQLQKYNMNNKEKYMFGSTYLGIFDEQHSAEEEKTDIVQRNAERAAIMFNLKVVEVIARSTTYVILKAQKS